MGSNLLSARLLEIENLRVEFATEDGVFAAVDDVSLHVDRGETLGIVGESGSGKSVTSLAVMRLIPDPPGRIVSGRIRFVGKDGQERDLVTTPEPNMRRIRGNDIAMIFQEPMTSLNPVYTVGEQIAETIMVHQSKGRHEALERAAHMLALMGIPDPKRRLDSYPHQMSGGMRQRVMIAMALSCNPSLLIADEPTTALDVTIQAQILELIKRLQQELGMAVVFITHNLGVVAEVANRVAVMYAGRIVEEAAVGTLFDTPRMPYSIGLLASIPRLGIELAEGQELTSIPGNVPSPLALPSGCSFHPRCRFAVAGLCDRTIPKLEKCGEGHSVRCLRWRDIALELAA
jgi:oligopeptide transport system ATP-binding protein